MKRLVIGLCTVSTRTVSYLTATVRSLAENLSPENQSDVLMRVYNCDLKDTHSNPRLGLEPFIDSGLLEIVRIDNHPEFHDLPRNFGDDEVRVRWRTKQNFDYGEAFRRSHGLGEYYMHVEDDIIACRNYDRYVFREIESNRNWSCIRMAQGGFIGWLFRDRDVPKVGALLQGFMDEMPCDWLIEHFVDIKKRIGQHAVTPRYSIFQHVGYERSLAGAVQPIRFSNFIREAAIRKR
jgi:hypothetical protein